MLPWVAYTTCTLAVNGFLDPTRVHYASLRCVTDNRTPWNASHIETRARISAVQARPRNSFISASAWYLASSSSNIIDAFLPRHDPHARYRHDLTRLRTRHDLPSRANALRSESRFRLSDLTVLRIRSERVTVETSEALTRIAAPADRVAAAHVAREKCGAASPLLPLLVWPWLGQFRFAS